MPCRAQKRLCGSDLPCAPLGHGWRSRRPTRRSAAAACGSAPRRLGQAHPGSKALGGVQPCFFSKPFLGAPLACISPPTAILSGSFSPGSTRGTAPAAAAMPQDFHSGAHEPLAPVVERGRRNAVPAACPGYARARRGELGRTVRFLAGRGLCAVPRPPPGSYSSRFRFRPSPLAPPAGAGIAAPLWPAPDLAPRHDRKPVPPAGIVVAAHLPPPVPSSA